MVYSLAALPFEGCGNRWEERQILHRVTKTAGSGIALERRATEGNSPVHETCLSSDRNLPSSAGSGKAGVNLRGPPRKAKYMSVTDSERVP